MYFEPLCPVVILIGEYRDSNTGLWKQCYQKRKNVEPVFACTVLYLKKGYMMHIVMNKVHSLFSLHKSCPSIIQPVLNFVGRFHINYNHEGCLCYVSCRMKLEILSSYLIRQLGPVLGPVHRAPPVTPGSSCLQGRRLASSGSHGNQDDRQVSADVAPAAGGLLNR